MPITIICKFVFVGGKCPPGSPGMVPESSLSFGRGAAVRKSAKDAL